MPQLKQLSCCVQWADTNAPFQEYATLYGDGLVESYIVVPNKPQSFRIRLTSRGFIYEGLAVMVFIDGVYQCNRSRVNLLPQKKDLPANRTEIDLVLRQKEKSHGGETFMGREWRFDNHNIVPETPDGVQESHFDDLGTIEVLVLRCRARDKIEAEYEGSSSGADSDIFDDRSQQQEQEEGSTVKAVPTIVEEETGMLGGFDIFGGDGTYDTPDVPQVDGGSDHRTDGRWVWHQKSTPSEHDFHQPPRPALGPSENYPCPSSQLPPRYRSPWPSNTPQGSTAHIAQPTKQVRFDYGPSGQPHSQPRVRSPAMQQLGSYSSIGRPPSRQRTRTPGTQAPNFAHEDLYPSQRLDTEQQRNQWGDTFPARHNYEDQPRWGYGNGNRAYVVQNVSDSRYHGGGFEQQRVQSSPTQPAPYTSQDRQYLKQSPPSGQQQMREIGSGMLPHLNQHYQPPPQYEPYAYPPTAHYAPGHAMPSSAPYAAHSQPSLGCPMAYSHGYPAWSVPYYGRYSMAHAGQFRSPGYGPNRSENPAPSGWHNGPAYVNTGQTSSQQWNCPNEAETINADGNNNINNNVGVNDNAADTNGDTWNNNNDNSANKDNNGGNTWVDDNGQNGDNNFQDNNANTNYNNTDWPNDNNDNTADDFNNNGNNWDNTGNDNGATGWDQQPNSSSAQDFNDWNKPDAQQQQQGTSSAENAPEAPRNLYGPHGPYYATRAPRPDEPQPDAGEEPRFDVPKSLALARRSTKQVQPGPGYVYYKKRQVPEYIDSLENPYARFIFKYRTKDQLKSEIGIEVDVEPTGDQEIQDLQNLNKQDLIDMCLRMKSALGGKVPSPPATPVSNSSQVNLPTAIDAPKIPYLKYSLPPLRPGFNASRSTIASAGSGAQTPVQNQSNGANNVNDNSWNTAANNNNSNNAADIGSWDLPDDKPPPPPPPANDDWNSGGANNASNDQW